MARFCSLDLVLYKYTMKHTLIIPVLLISGAFHAEAMIPVVDGGAIAQLASQTSKLGEQLTTLKNQYSTLLDIYRVNDESLSQTTQIMQTLGTTQQFKENNQGLLGQLGELQGGMNLGGNSSSSGGGDVLSQVGSLFGGGGNGGGGGLLEGFAGLTEPLSKVAATAGKYGDQLFDIYSTGGDLYSTASGMIDGSVDPVTGVMSIAKNLFGGGGNGMSQRMNNMSLEDMLKYGGNINDATASMWNQATLASAKQQYQDQLFLAQQREKLKEMAASAETQSDHMAVQNQLQLLQLEQQAQALNMQAQGSISGAASQESSARIKREEQARRMGQIQATRY